MEGLELFTVLYVYGRVGAIYCIVCVWKGWSYLLYCIVRKGGSYLRHCVLEVDFHCHITLWDRKYLPQLSDETLLFCHVAYEAFYGVPTLCSSVALDSSIIRFDTPTVQS